MELGEVDSSKVDMLCDRLSVSVIQVPVSPQKTLLYNNTHISEFPMHFQFMPPLAGEHVVAAPAIQIFSISVHPNFNDERPFKIHGSIGVEVQPTGWRHTTLSLFDRGPSDCETILKQGSLSLTGLDGGAIPYYMDNAKTSLDLNLKDMTRDVEVLKTRYDLFSRTEDIEDSCDKLLRAQIRGEHGFASVYYTMLKYAVFATVSVGVFETTGNFADIYGNIVAAYANVGKYGNSDELKYMQSIIFNRSFDRSLHAMIGSPFPLSGAVIAVPAYSSLVIELDLSDSHGEFAKGSVEFVADRSGQFSKLIEGKGGLILVDVNWDTAYRCYFRERASELLADDTDSEDGDRGSEMEDQDTKDEDKILEALYSALSPWGPVSMRSIVSKYLKSVSGFWAIEIFSVFVSGNVHGISALCGTVEVQEDGLRLYDRDESNFESLLSENSVASIEGHSAISSSSFSISIDLKDPIQKLEVSKGSLSWCHGTLESPYLGEMSWFDKRLCSVVPGANGYAAVHYTIFREAFKALVEVTLSCNKPSNDMSPANVYGLLLARYGSHDYSTSYEKKYFQSRLFDRQQGRAAQLSKCAKIPLLKSVVVVPNISSLIVEAKLWAMCDGNQTEPLYGEAEFENDLSGVVSKQIIGEHYQLQVSVKFVDFLDIKC